MEGSESSMNRIGRTIWTVWGFLSGAVGRYLRPEVTSEDDHSKHVQQEDAVAKSYKELKENEEEQERSAVQAQGQSERPQSGVSVRTAAAQWEKGKVRREHMGRPTSSGVVWSTGVQERQSEDKKAQEQRDNKDTSENNEAARTNELVASVDQVCPPVSTKGSQDFSVSASDKDVDARRSENETDDMVKSERANREREAMDESAEKGHFADIVEVSVEKEPTDDEDTNDEDDECTSQMADDLVSSAREQGDLLNKELKVVETTENKATATPEREVIDVNNVKTKQDAVGTVKDRQHETCQQFIETKTVDVCESQLDEEQIKFTEEIVQTKHELLEEPVTGQIENTETYEEEPESISKIIEKKIQAAPEREPINNIEECEARQQLSESKAAETLGISASKLVEDQTEGIETAYKLLDEPDGQQFSESKAFDIFESKLDESQFEFTEGTVETKHVPLEEPVTGQIDHVEVYEKEPEPSSKIIEKKVLEREMVDEEAKQVAADGQHEPGQQLSEFIASEIADKLDIHGSMVEAQLGERVEVKREPLAEPVTRQVENAEVYEEEPEPISLIIETKTPEREVIIEEPKQETVGTVQDGQQFSESKAFDIFGSNQDKAQIEFPEGIVETKHGPLEEPVTGQTEHVEVYEKEPEPAPEREAIMEESRQGTVETAPDEAGQQFSDSKPAEIVVCDSKLEEFTEEMVETESELLEEHVTEQMDNAEPFGQDLERFSKRIENKTTPEREVIDAVNEETKQETVGTVKDGQHEAGQKFSESEGFDIFESKLGGPQIEFTAETVETTREPLEEPVTGLIEHIEVYEKESEPVSTINENKAPEGEMINVIIEGTKQVAADGQHEVGLQLSEFIASGIAHKLDVQIEFTEETVKTKHEPLEEPVTGLIEHVEVYEKEPKPISGIIERDVIIKEPKQETVGTAQDGQQFSESKAFDIFETKLDETYTEFTEEIVETIHEPLKEPVTGQIEHAEIYKEDSEPISKIEKMAPEREAVIAEAKHETVGTAPDEADQQFSESKAAEIVDVYKSTLDECTEEVQLLEEPVTEQMETVELFGQDQDICESEPEAQVQFTEEIVVTDYKLLEEPVMTRMENAETDEKGLQAICKMDLMVKVTSGNEQVDGGTDFSAFIVEADQFKHCKGDIEEEPVLKAEVELVDGTSHNLIGLQVAELVIKQGSESVDTGPGNQTETTSEFQQVRGEVAADDVKKSAERSFGQLTVREALALQETMGQSNLEEESTQEKSEARVNEMQREAKSLEQDYETSDVMPRPSLQELDQPEDSFAARAELITNQSVETKANVTEPKVEVPETHIKLTAQSDQGTTEVKCVRAKSEIYAKTESESSLTAVEALETFRTSASILDEGQVPLNHGEWTMQDRSDVETEVLIGYSGASSLPESEPMNRQMSEIRRSMQKDTDEALEMQRDPDEAKIGLQDEIKATVTSLGVVEEITSGPTQNFKEAQSLSNEDVQTETKEKESDVETSDCTALQVHSEFSKNTLEDRKHSQAETMDIESEACGENPQKLKNVELFAKEKSGQKANDEAEVDSNANIQEKSRPALKRGSEKMTRDVEDESSKSRSWATTDLLLQQVSSLDCTVQKSKIAVKNPHVRPPKDPRTLINMPSVEPLAPARPPQPGPLRRTHGEAVATPQKVIGFKLPGLGAGFPALRKTEAGKKMRDEGETESPLTQTQKSDTQTGPKEDSVKQEQPANKPKWTPPRHPGMGNPLMMSELRSKLKKPGKD
ncbi:titin [Pygocentrus nattereri]|uniref:titin n=1 Tax=Pygocentrus nattereri TaxID=42514 RepID=UPI00081482D3|nr:titin [Pygocentrus nattereri]